MITQDEVEAACRRRIEDQKIIDQFYREKEQRLQQRLASRIPFTDKELTYSATKRCPCGHGLAYPNECGIHHWWDCSAILKKRFDPNIKHTDQLPFTFYEIQSESADRSTRPT